MTTYVFNDGWGGEVEVDAYDVDEAWEILENEGYNPDDYFLYDAY